MGWKSTISVNRQEMEQAVCDAFARLDLQSMSDDDLSSLLEAVSGGDSHGYNYSVARDHVKDGFRPVEEFMRADEREQWKQRVRELDGGT